MFRSVKSVDDIILTVSYTSLFMWMDMRRKVRSLCMLKHSICGLEYIAGNMDLCQQKNVAWDELAFYPTVNYFFS
jgi:hypothetical protein